MLNWINDLFDHDAAPDAVSLLPNGLRTALHQLLEDCESLYRSAARRCIQGCPELIKVNIDDFPELMRDLHRGVLLKTLIEVAHCDRKWSQAEREVAVIVLQHVWGVRVSSNTLSQALQNVVEHAQVLKWSELLKPFVEYPLLRNDAQGLRSLILRLANLVAKADGQVLPAELRKIKEMESDIDSALSTNETPKSSDASQGIQIAELVHCGDGDTPAANKSGTPAGSEPSSSPGELPTAEERQRMFAEAERELRKLIGLDSIKADVQQLIDFLKVQSARKELALPTTDISFHAVFQGNPGTGKTTVARIVSRLLCGLGILEKGQTIETDRSGLVAEYAGQTGPRTNERVDEALGGVLFVDEAYSLVAAEGEDHFGKEAMQALLKRIEDDRDRLVVVLAGYPEPMQRMLRSNPGLLSRFQRTYQFEDYSARELLRIFYVFCKQFHYELPRPTRRKLLDGFQARIDAKDEHFGNGRLARNVFEQSIRNMSTRIVDITPLSRELLTTIEPEDIQF